MWVGSGTRREITHPLQGLLSSKQAWLWGSNQEAAFIKAKEALTKPTILALHCPGSETKFAADASSFGLGAVLLQRVTSEWWSVAYASQPLSATEQLYAQIEKVAYASQPLSATEQLYA